MGAAGWPGATAEGQAWAWASALEEVSPVAWAVLLPGSPRDVLDGVPPRARAGRSPGAPGGGPAGGPAGGWGGGPAGAHARSPVTAGASQYRLVFASALPSDPLQATREGKAPPPLHSLTSRFTSRQPRAEFDRQVLRGM